MFQISQNMGNRGKASLQRPSLPKRRWFHGSWSYSNNYLYSEEKRTLVAVGQNSLTSGLCWDAFMDNVKFVQEDSFFKYGGF